jgi:hypothetical protein
MATVWWSGLRYLRCAALSAWILSLSACLPSPQSTTQSYTTQVTVSSLDCDAVAWRRMSFRDPSDRVIAAADSGGPLGDGTAGCTVRFAVQLPRASAYILDNGSRRTAPFSFDDLRAAHFAVALRLR